VSHFGFVESLEPGVLYAMDFQYGNPQCQKCRAWKRIREDSTMNDNLPAICDAVGGNSLYGKV